MKRSCYSACSSNAIRVYSGKRKEDAADAIQNVATDLEQSVGSEVVLKVGSQVEENVASESVQNTASNKRIYGINNQIGVPNSIFQQLDPRGVDFEDFTSSQSDDAHNHQKKLQSIHLPENNENVQWVDLSIDGGSLEVEETVDLTSEQNTDIIRFIPNVGENLTNTRWVKSLPTHNVITKPIRYDDVLLNQDAEDVEDTEVVWLPVSPSKQSQETNEDASTVLRAAVRENGISKIIKKGSIAPLPNRNYKSVHSVTCKPNSTKIKRYSLSKMMVCKQWLKHAHLPKLEQDIKLMEYMTYKIDLNSILESRDYIKNIVSQFSLRLSKLFANSGKNPQMLLRNYCAWLNRPLLVFTQVNKKSTISSGAKKTVLITKKQPGNTPVEKPQTSTKVLRLSLVTNTDVFKFLKMSRPPFREEALYAILTALSNGLIQEKQQKVKEFCKRYVADMKFKWMTADYKDNVFESKFAFWLGLNVRWPAFLKAVFESKNPKSNAAVNAEMSLDIKELEQDIAKKCCDYGQGDISNIIHRLFHHPEDAVRIQSFVENSVCSCNPKSVESDNSTEQDPLMIESEIYRTTDASEGVKLTDNNTLERVYKAPSGARLDALKQTLNKLKDKTKDRVQIKITAQINKETERRDMVKQVLYKLNSETANIVSTPAPTKETNTVVSTPALTKETNKVVNTPALTKESNQKEWSKTMEFGPVLDQLIFLKSELKVESGTKVKLSTGGMATVVKVSNVRGSTVLMPQSNIQIGVKVHPKRSNKCKNTMRPKPGKRKQIFPETSSNKQRNPPIASSIEKRKIGILRRSSNLPYADNLRIIKKFFVLDQPATSTTKQVKVTGAPSISQKVSPVQSSSTTKTIRVYNKGVPSSSINSSVEALMADINNGNMQQKETVQTSLSRLISHSKMLQSSKITTAKLWKEPGVQPSLNQLISHYKGKKSENLSKADCDDAKKTKTSIVLTPKVMGLVSQSKTEPLAKKRLSEQTESDDLKDPKRPLRLEE